MEFVTPRKPGRAHWLVGLIAAGAMLTGCSAGSDAPAGQQFILTPNGAVPVDQSQAESMQASTAPDLARITAAQDITGRFVVIVGAQGAVGAGAQVRLRDVTGMQYEVAASELGSFRAESFPEGFRLEGGDRLSISQAVDDGPESPAVKLELPDWVCSGEV